MYMDTIKLLILYLVISQLRLYNSLENNYYNTQIMFLSGQHNYYCRNQTI